MGRFGGGPGFWIVVLGVLGLAAVACSSGAKPGGSASLATGSPTTDAWPVPKTIDAAYLDRVLAFLDHVDGDALRDARANNAVTPKYLQLETAIRSSQKEVTVDTRDVQQSIATGWPNIKAVPGDRIVTVTKILPSTAPCVFAAVNVDFRSVASGAPAAYPPWYLALIPGPSTSTNPTHWVLSSDGFNDDGSQPTAQAACAP